MIIELLATCLLAAGQTYVPSEGWAIDRVGIQGDGLATCTQSGFLMNCQSLFFQPIERSYVVVRRAARAGDKIVPPPGCDLEVTAR